MVKVKDLREGQEYGMLRCSKCHAEYSADKRDYWNLPDSYVFKCCRKGMQLVRKVVSYQPVSCNV